jgi:hypothetical protein
VGRIDPRIYAAVRADLAAGNPPKPAKKGSPKRSAAKPPGTLTGGYVYDPERPCPTLDAQLDRITAYLTRLPGRSATVEDLNQECGVPLRTLHARLMEARAIHRHGIRITPGTAATHWHNGKPVGLTRRTWSMPKQPHTTPTTRPQAIQIYGNSSRSEH